MSGFETYQCEQCDASFKAHPSAPAAGTAYCSPACEVKGKGLH